MRVGKETYYMVAIYLAPFYLLVCVYILLRSLHWFQVLHTVFQNVWVCRGIGLVYLFVVFSILIAFMAPASGFRRFMKLLSNYWLGVLMYTLMFSWKRAAFQQYGNCCCGSCLCSNHFDSQYLWSDQCWKYTYNKVQYFC